jgi:hypothetical protein
MMGIDTGLAEIDPILGLTSRASPNSCKGVVDLKQWLSS